MKKSALSIIFESILLLSLYTNTFAFTKVCDVVNVTAEQQTVPAEEMSLLAEKAVTDILCGEGTAENPFQICDALDFITAKNMVESNNSLYGQSVYELKNCIDFNGEVFSPIGNSGAAFKGEFKGNGHTLYNVSVCDVPYFGVIGYMESGKISDLHVEYISENCELKNTYSFGGIVGDVSVESTSSPIYISGCSTKGSIEIKTSINMTVGGIIGNGYSNKNNFYVNDCVSYMDFTLNSTNEGKIGGIVGKVSSRSNKSFAFENCVAYGNISLVSDVYGGYCGGFGGLIKPDETDWSQWVDLLAESYDLKNCIAFGDVINTCGFGNAGGFCAYEDEHLSYSNCIVSSSQIVSADVVEKMGTSKSISQLQSKTTLSSNYGFDFETKWALDEDGKLVLLNKCTHSADDEHAFKSFKLSDKYLSLIGFGEESYTLAVSSYKDSVLSDIKFVTVSSDILIPLSEVGLDMTDAESVEAFLFEKESFFKPVCESASVILT